MSRVNVYPPTPNAAAQRARTDTKRAPIRSSSGAKEGMAMDGFRSAVLYWWVMLGWGLIIISLLVILIFEFMGETSHTDYRQLHIGTTQISVEIADDSGEQYQGLSGRSALANDTGMLFIYKQKANSNFWMKDMKFALDFVWIADNEVIQIDANIQPPATPQAEPVIIYPRARYNMVLEVPAGWVNSNNIKVGDQVELK